MLKMRKLNYKYFYLFYFVLNLINAYILTSGVLHSNISPYAFQFDEFLSSLVGNLGILLLFFSIALIFFSNTTTRIRFLTGISAVFMVICLGQAIFANIFATFFKFAHLKSFNNPTQATYVMFYLNYAFQMMVNPAIFIHIIPFILLCVSRLFIIKESGRLYSPIYKIGLLLGSLLFMISPVYLLNNNISNTIYNNSISGAYGSHQVGLYNYFLYDFVDFMSGDKPPITAEQSKVIGDHLVEKEKDEYINPLSGQTVSVINEFTGLAEDKNLLLVQLEAFNSFLVNLEIDGVEIMPNLNQIYNNSLSFDNFYSSTGIGNTSDSEFSAMTGLYGNGNDLTIFNFAKDNYYTLAKDFRAKGYSAVSFHGNIGAFYRRNIEHMKTLGFEKHYDLGYFQETNPKAPLLHGYLDDKYFLPEVAKVLANEEKFFGLAITITSHSPYVPTPLIKQHDFKDLTYLANNYIDFVMHVDNALGLFFDELEKSGLLENTVIAFYGDHSSSLFIEDVESILDSQLTEVDYRTTMQNVPFFLYNESIFTPTVNHKVGGTVDIYRTMSNLFNLDSHYNFANDLNSNEPGFSYNPRNLDLIFDDAVIFYPSGEVFTEAKIDQEKYIKYFENYKYVNDLILKSDYFK